jgi:hypothetical protein
MKKECELCERNPEMAEARLHINSFLMGSLFTVLALIWTFSSEKISSVLIVQMVLAIPLILFASLSYAKTGCNGSNQIWYRFGWITNNIGYLLFFNVTGLIVATFSSVMISFTYFGLILFLSATYYIFNIIAQPGTFKEHFTKLLFYWIVTLLGGILPLLI